jgi:hypothetical protein
MAAGFNWFKCATYSVSDYFIIISEGPMNLIHRLPTPKVIDSRESSGDDR